MMKQTSIYSFSNYKKTLFNKGVCLLISCSFLLAAFSLLFSSCVEVEEYKDTPKGNFELLWKVMDEHYCFFEYKDVDWDEVFVCYKDRITNDLNRDALFSILCEMLAELKDGHVNLSSSFDVGRYWSWFEDYPMNYNEAVVRTYLGTDYRIASGFKYRILEDNIGYMRYPDFSVGIGEGNLDYILHYLRDCDGIIIDVRENGGGLLSNSEILASRFIEEKTLVSYIQHKTGKGHNDFSKPKAQYLKPTSSRVNYLKPVVVITNRRCYSTTNDFVNSMRYCPYVTILGDITGGGSGLPYTYDLLNGWRVRLSASPMYDAEMKQIEFGIEPDIYVDLKNEDVALGKDTLIEAALNLLRK